MARIDAKQEEGLYTMVNASVFDEIVTPQAEPTLGGYVARRLTLRQVRVSNLMSANELGKRAGVAASTVLKIEEGAVPRLATIRKLASALDVEATDIEWPGDPLGLLDSDHADE